MIPENVRFSCQDKVAAMSAPMEVQAQLGPRIPGSDWSRNNRVFSSLARVHIFKVAKLGENQ